MVENKARRDRFWLFLSAILITIFVIQRESGNRVEFHLPRQEARVQSQDKAYDRHGMASLVAEAQSEPTRREPAFATSDDDLITGSIASSGYGAPKPMARPAAAESGALGGSYYVMLGAYPTIEDATTRYIEILNREPDLRGNERVSIETIRARDGRRLHNVRMGAFSSDRAARAACARAALEPAECAVVAL